VTLHIVAEFHTRLQRLGYRWLLPHAARLAACSDAVGKSFLRSFAIPPRRMTTVPNGVSTPRDACDWRTARRRLGCEENVLAVGAAGRLVEQKGFADLIAAMGHVNDRIPRRVRLFLLGDGPLRDDLEHRIREAGLEDTVTLTGLRSDAQQLLAAFDVVAFSSVDEGLPMALLEAMAAGRCIVATDVGGIGDAVRDEREGLLVPPREPARLAAALCRALGDHDLRSRLGVAAARRFRDRFTARRMVADYERLYRATLGRAPSAPRPLHAVERG
jgi:glycosyltransferase involved in cell wall biosynthesis